MWDDIGRALALLLVLEGLMPFLSPRRFRKGLLDIASLEDRWMRAAGLACMLGGLLILNFALA